MHDVGGFDKGMIVRTAVLAVALINQMFVNAGYSALPFDDGNVEFAVTSLLTFSAAVAAWWSNNSITRKARQADKLAKQKGLK